MSRILLHVGMSLRLHFRNRLAVIYGHLFPVLFVIAFWILYRGDGHELSRHFGQLLVLAVLAGTCFGLPTTLVAERERGVWRRYRLAPASTAGLLGSAVAARVVLLITAAIVQWTTARALGMPAVNDVATLVFAFTAVAFAFIGVGLVMAMLAPNVLSVQALGQCVFLPMLIVGGVAVPLTVLPDWMQRAAVFMPGMHAVNALQAGVLGTPLNRSDLAALVTTGLAAWLAAGLMFRWNPGQAPRIRRVISGLAVVAVSWCVIGFASEPRAAGGRHGGEATVSEVMAVVPPVKAAPWRALRAEDLPPADMKLPSDDGVVTPFAAPDEPVDDYVVDRLKSVGRHFIRWQPAYVADPVQRVRNCISAVVLADIGQSPVERHLPPWMLEQLLRQFRPMELRQILGWIVLHPDEGTVLTELDMLGLPEAATDDEPEIRRRLSIYAMKLMARIPES